ncbi:MAG: iron uptake porin [Symploca sp. SIO2E6]|nr:iron uptake porin [Symploca sp. SIO2E6]
MKYCLNLEKKVSSTLIFATLGCLVAHLSPAQAAPELNTTTAVSTESISEELSVSTDLSRATEVVEEVVDNQSTEIAATDLAEEAATNNLNLPEIPLTDLETEAVAETKVQDLLSSETLEVQTPPHPETSESGSPVLMPMAGGETLGEDDPMGQVTDVSDLLDVQPSDWAYEAVRELVERYKCLVGYPDRTFRGNQPTSRYEFAAGLRACLDTIAELVDAGNLVTQEDFEVLQRLTQEFEAELALVGARIDNLDSRVAFIEDHQFSPTTKLFGQAIFGLQGRSQDNRFEIGLQQRLPNADLRLTDTDDEITFINNVQLSLFTQFSPRSLLLTSLQAGNGNTNPTFSNTLGNFTRLGYEGDTGNNDVVLTDLNFRQLIGDSFALIVGPEGVNPVNVFRGVNRIESAGSGPISSFAQRNPIIGVGVGGAGIGFDWQIATALSLQAVYSASIAEEPVNGGIFGGNNGETTVGAQLVVSPVDTVDISLQYINAYSPFGRLGTGIGDDQVVLLTIPGGQTTPERDPINTNAFGATLEWRVTPNFTIGGWGGYTDSNYQEASGDVETWNWMGFLNFPDLLGEGNLLGIYVGQPPKISSSNLPNGKNVPSFVSQGDLTAGPGDQPSSTTHVEAFYRWQISDNISITPGVIVIINPLHNGDNDTITIGALRTTFTF